MPRNSDDHDLFAGTLDVMILHLLRLKPMHGYALVRTSRKFQTICCRSNRSLGRRHQAPGKGTFQFREDISGISRGIAVQ